MYVIACYCVIDDRLTVVLLLNLAVLTGGRVKPVVSQLQLLQVFVTIAIASELMNVHCMIG